MTRLAVTLVVCVIAAYAIVKQDTVSGNPTGHGGNGFQELPPAELDPDDEATVLKRSAEKLHSIPKRVSGTPTGDVDEPPPAELAPEENTTLSKRSAETLHSIVKRGKKTVPDVGCEHPGELRYGSQTSGQEQGQVPTGEKLTFKCNDDFTMYGAESIECNYHSKLGNYWSFYKPLCSKMYDYNVVLRLSDKFYEAQRSGKLPEDGNRIKWRSDSALADGSLSNKDLTGGWYDAGDHVKFNLPMASATTLLGWGFIEFFDAYKNAGEVGRLLDNIRWSCEYFIKTLDDDPDITKVKVYYQVGDPIKDHEFWGRAEDMPENNRDVYTCTCDNPCSDVAGETSSALSVCSMAFNMTTQYQDTVFARKALDAAFRLYEFAKHEDCRGVYRQSGFYSSRSFWDEIVEASMFLYYATKQSEFLSDAHAGEGLMEDVVEHLVRNGGENTETYVPLYDLEAQEEIFIDEATDEFDDNTGALQAVAASLSWGDKRPAVHLLLYKFLSLKADADSNEKSTMKKAMGKIVTYLDTWMHRVPYVPGGLRIRDIPYGDWGSNRYAANTAFVAIMAAHYNMKMPKNGRPYSFYEWRRFATEQIHYMLGDHGQCYVVGFADGCCERPHHRDSSCPTEGSCGFGFLTTSDPNPHVLEGALCGGPDKDGGYFDNREDYFHNEVTCDFNAGFQSAVAGLSVLKSEGKLPYLELS
ncbi:uncharacterized protein LOC100369592 [Saccoglossus kowalevskii]|uniref:Endoglucanase n=1 Tax=Saccoglossus kowalevskii TaxID=10224 RepID=A0ABM0MZA8_SACKO|nr:PREDICTED: endoglucanase 9-like [Saccoglossus kowalevskii]